MYIIFNKYSFKKWHRYVETFTSGPLLVACAILTDRLQTIQTLNIHPELVALKNSWDSSFKMMFPG